MQVEQATKQLSESIRSTDIYKNFNLQLSKVKNIPELKNKIDEFRIRNFELQNSENVEGLMEKIEAFDEEYAAFRENPIVEDFLEAELGLCRMMQEIYEDLTKTVNIEL